MIMWPFKKKRKELELEFDHAEADWRFSFERKVAWLEDSMDVQGVVHLNFQGSMVCQRDAYDHRILGDDKFFSQPERQARLDEAYRQYLDKQFEDIVLS